jgi:hypothetical protein
MKYLIALFGSLLYNVILFKIAKDKCDDAGIELDYGKYFKMNWDNWLVTILAVPVLVFFMPDIVYLINKHLSSEIEGDLQILYLGAGPLSEIMIFAVGKLLGWKKSIITQPHTVDQSKP